MTASDFKLHTFQVDTVVVSQLRKLRHPILATYLIIVLVFACIVIVNALQRTLTTDQLRLAIEHDLRRIFGLDFDAYDSTSFPLLRDTASIIILASLSMCVPQILKQWSKMDMIYAEVVGRGILEIDPSKVSDFVSGISNLNKKFERLGRISALLMAGSTVGAFIVTTSLRVSPIFATFEPPNSPDGWLDSAYEGWWASSDNAAGFVVYVLAAAIAIYYVVLQNYVGIHFCMFAYKHRKHMIFHPNEVDPRYRYGFRLVVDLLRTASISMFFSALALVTFLAILAEPFTVWILPPSALWLVGAVVYTAIPFSVLRRPMEAWKDGEQELCRLEEDAAKEEYDRGTIDSRTRTSRIENAKARSEAVASLSMYPLRDKLIQLVAVVSPPVAAVASIVQAVR